MVIARQALPRTAPRVVAALAATLGRIRMYRIIRIRAIPRRRAAAAVAVEEDLAEA